MIDFSSIQKREILSKKTISLRIYESDLAKLKKIAKDKGMKLNSFIAETLHFALNTK